MVSFSYNTDDFPPLPSNESSPQSALVYIAIKPGERDSKVISFSKTVNPLLFEKNMFVCTSKAYMFPLQSDDIQSDTRSPVLSRKSFVCIISVPSHACSSPVPPIAVRNCKNICNRSIRCISVSSSSSNVESISEPAYPVVSSSYSVTNISKSLKFTLTNSHSIDSGVVSHCNIHRKRKLHESVISSSLVNSADSHDIASKLIVGRDIINVSTKPGNYYMSSVFFYRYYFGSF